MFIALKVHLFRIHYSILCPVFWVFLHLLSLSVSILMVNHVHVYGILCNKDMFTSGINQVFSPHDFIVLHFWAKLSLNKPLIFNSWTCHGLGDLDAPDLQAEDHRFVPCLGWQNLQTILKCTYLKLSVSWVEYKVERLTGSQKFVKFSGIKDD